GTTPLSFALALALMRGLLARVACPGVVLPRGFCRGFGRIAGVSRRSVFLALLCRHLVFHRFICVARILLRLIFRSMRNTRATGVTAFLLSASACILHSHC